MRTGGFGMTSDNPAPGDSVAAGLRALAQEWQQHARDSDNASDPEVAQYGAIIGSCADALEPLIESAERLEARLNAVTGLAGEWEHSAESSTAEPGSVAGIRAGTLKVVSSLLRSALEANDVRP
jgi:hypothetical protein